MSGTPLGEPRRGNSARGSNRQRGRAPCSKPTGEVRRAAQPDCLEGGRGERRCIALVAHHNPLDVRVYGLWNPMRTGWMQSPLQMIALDDDRAGHFSIGAPLELRTDVD